MTGLDTAAMVLPACADPTAVTAWARLLHAESDAVKPAPFLCCLRRRRRGPPPFSSMNSTRPWPSVR